MSKSVKSSSAVQGAYRFITTPLPKANSILSPLQSVTHYIFEDNRGKSTGFPSEHRTGPSPLASTLGKTSVQVHSDTGTRNHQLFTEGTIYVWPHPGSQGCPMRPVSPHSHNSSPGASEMCLTNVSYKAVHLQQSLRRSVPILLRISITQWHANMSINKTIHCLGVSHTRKRGTWHTPSKAKARCSTDATLKMCQQLDQVLSSASHWHRSDHPPVLKCSLNFFWKYLLAGICLLTKTSCFF